MSSELREPPAKKRKSRFGPQTTQDTPCSSNILISDNSQKRQQQALAVAARLSKQLGLSDNASEKKQDNYKSHETGTLCKFYGAGYCYYGSKCYSLHNSDKINEYEEAWLNSKIIINKQPLPLISLDSGLFAKQKYDYLLVLDLEGKDEIIELPCILIDLLSMKEVSRFHCWIRPTKWDKGYIPKNQEKNNDFVNVKSRAIPFGKALQLLSEWLGKFDIYLNKNGEYITNATTNGKSKSFLCAICGNWDIKTQIPKQCKICNIKLPNYFHQWMNIKDFALTVYPNFKAYQVKGMFTLLKNLNMKLYGTHHLGMDDTYNIARIIIKFAMNHAVFDYTAKRDNSTQKVIYRNNNSYIKKTNK